MHVALICYEYPLLSQTFVLEQVRQLRARGHDVTVIADRAGQGPVDDIDGVDVVYSCRPNSARDALLRAPGAIARLIRAGRWSALFRSFDAWHYGRQAWQLRLLYTAAALPPVGSRTIDAVVAHFGPNGVVGSYLIDTGFLDAPLAVAFHGYDVRSETRRASSRRAYRRLFAERPTLLPVSERLQGLLVELGADPATIEVLHMGVDSDSFSASEPSDIAGPLRVLSVGRLTEKKGFAVGLRAADTVAARTPVHYTIIGDGELRSELITLAETLEHVEVELLGAQGHDEVRSHLRRADLFLAPSLTAPSGDEEGIPVVLMEAMASALPVVSTDHAGIPELVRSGVDGVLVPENDEPALAAALSELAEDPDRRRQLGEAARRTVQERFDSVRLARDLEQILTHPRER